MEYREQAQQRLNQLREELRSGKEQLSHLEQRVDELKQTLLRISGAIQVLEELENQHKPSE